jgi:hypothetical protein
MRSTCAHGGQCALTPQPAVRTHGVLGVGVTSTVPLDQVRPWSVEVRTRMRA